ncbi:MAG: proteasome-type protease [Pirellulales bacterium]|nr:proteasome-type protease [Pirellulales bacterium]
MTFCVAMKVEDGLVGIADTRITTGSECITARKLTVLHHAGHDLFLLTSGLRSVRDKALTYFEEELENSETTYDRLYKALNALAEQTRRVAAEDRPALEAANLMFNFYALVGGQLEHDKEPKLYLLYPQGNWVEVGPGTPYCIIGETGYGKPILDRTLKYSDSLEFALKVGALAFDSTRISSATVDFPLDTVIYDSGSRQMIQCRYDKAEMGESSSWWQERLRASLNELPSGWTEKLLGQLRPGVRHGTIPLTPPRSG